MADNKLKVLMTADAIGGVWIYAIELCKGLEHYNVEVHLAILGALPSELQKQQTDALSNVSLYESDYKLEWMEDPMSDVFAARDWLKSLYFQIQPDLIHFNNFGQVDFQWECPAITVFHSCVQTWFRSVKNIDAPHEWNQYKKLVADALTTSDVVVFPSLSMKKDAEAIYRNTNSVIIYNGSSATEKSTNKEPFIFCAGRIWDEAKNVQLLLEIAPSLSWPVVIAGKGSEGLSRDNVTFLGQISHTEVQDYMARAAIYVLPAKYEPFGLSVLEAAKAGCALALSNIATFSELWEDCAIYFDPDDSDAARETLEKLTTDLNFRKYLAARSRQKSSNYTTRRMTDKYYNLYLSIVTQNEPQNKHQ